MSQLALISLFVSRVASGLGLSLLEWLGVPLRATGWWFNVF